MSPAFSQGGFLANERIRRIGLTLIGCSSFAVVTASLLMPWNYALALSILSMLLVVIFIRPDWGTYSLIFLVPLTTASVHFYIKKDWNFIIANKGIDMIPVFAPFVIGTFVGSMARKFGRIGSKTQGDFLIVPLFIILCYSAATVIWSQSPVHSLFQSLLFAMNIAIFWVITVQVQTEEHLVMAVRCFILSILLQAAVYVLCFFLDPYSLTYKIFDGFFLVLKIAGGYFQPSGMPMVDGGFLDHHELALLANLALAVTFGHFLNQSGHPRQAWLAFPMGIFVFVILHTESRAGIGALLVMIFCSLFFFQITRKRFIHFSLIILLLLPSLYTLNAVVIGKITGQTTTPRLFVLGSKMVKTRDVIDPGIKKKDEGRSQLWKNSFRRYSNYAIQGLGAGNLKRVSQAPHAHSIFLSFLFDFGLSGLMTIVVIVGFLLKRFGHLLRHQSSYSQIMAVAFGSGLTAIAFHGQFDFEYNTTSLWLYLGLTVAAFRLSFQETTGNIVKW